MHGEIYLLDEIVRDESLHHTVVRVTGCLQIYDAVRQLATIEYKGGPLQSPFQGGEGWRSDPPLLRLTPF